MSLIERSKRCGLSFIESDGDDYSPLPFLCASAPVKFLLDFEKLLVNVNKRCDKEII